MIQLSKTIALMLCAGALSASLACNKQPAPHASAPATPRFVGRATCAPCHPQQNDLWRGSDHDLAMQHAAPVTVLGDFDNTQFTYNGMTSTFYRRDDRFLVRTEAADGSLQEFEVAYTFGHKPLQQYLIRFPDGRVQALGIAWDTRPDSAGGQRWFHLYPDAAIDADDFLHWTQPAQNWNHMCADCHSTDFQKNYDEESNTFASTWSEINVSCEACHGPGSRHVEWAQQRNRLGATPTNDPPSAAGEDRGLLLALSDVDAGRWILADSSATATRLPPRSRHVELETCASCHSRRLTVAAAHAGDSFLDNHRPAFITEDLYYPDGQIRDEVFVYGSFLQSRMYHAGVTCSDCHDPHRLDVGFTADMACNQCHVPSTFASRSHHFHEIGSSGASCVECHMPETTYMVIDPRRDHSIRIPRPDLTIDLGVPNACNQCHQDESAQWALQAVRRWYGDVDQPSAFATAMKAAFDDSLEAESKLLAVADDRQQPAFLRASAVLELGNHLTGKSAVTLRSLLADADPLVRFAAVQASHGIPPQNRWPFLVPVLVDPLRLIRAEAASRLAESDLTALPPDAMELFEAALAEYEAIQRFNADRAESHLNLGVLSLQLGDAAAAEGSYRRALRLSPRVASVYVNLADLYQQLGREDDCAATLQIAAELDPQNAAVQHALGLQRVRIQKMEQGMRYLENATELEPDNWRYAYVWGVGLHSTGQDAKGIAVLEETHRQHPANVDVLVALATFESQRGHHARALGYATKLRQLAPADPGIAELLQAIADAAD